MITRFLKSRPRLFLALAAMPVLYVLMPAALSPVLRGLLAWNTAALGFLVSITLFMRKTPVAKIHHRAKQQDIGENFVLILSFMTAFLSLAAIALELRGIHDAAGNIQLAHVGIVALTILTSWCFVHTIFGLHYAHEYYDRGTTGEGLTFPQEPAPDYFDFMYFSFTVGAAFATSDVNICSRKMRRLVLVQTIFSFIYNTMILGLTVNVGAGLL